MAELELLKLAVKNIGKETWKTYELMPQERFAESDSWERLDDILELVRSEGSNLIELCNTRKLQGQLFGYKFSKTPVSKYFDYHHIESSRPVFTNLVLAKAYCPDYRIRARLGLPLYPREIRLLKQEINRQYKMH